MALSPDERHLYAASLMRLRVFQRDHESGNVSLVEERPVGELSGTFAAVAVSPDGRQVCAVSAGRMASGSGAVNAGVAVFERNETDGKLRLLEIHSDFAEGLEDLAGARTVVVSPDGRQVYLTTSLEGGGVIPIFARDRATGSLDFHGADPIDIGRGDGFPDVRAATVSPDGRHLYVTGLTDSPAAVFERDPESGALRFLQAVPAGAGGLQGLFCSLIVSPDGRHVYVDSTLGSIVILARDEATGTLSVQTTAEIGPLGRVSSMTLSSDGRHLYIASSSDDAVAVFERDSATGALSLLEVHVDGSEGIEGLDGADSTALPPDGRHLYVASDHDNAVGVFERDESTGALRFLDAFFNGANGITGPAGVEVGPEGRRVYVIASNGIAEFERNPATGGLRFLTFGDLADVESVMMSPDGELVLATRRFQDAVVVFHRDPSTGHLALIEGHYEHIGAVNGLRGPGTLAMSPDGRHVYAGGLTGVTAFARNEGSCPTGPFVQCLADDRFQVEVEWLDFQGNTGFGRPVPLGTNDSGLFWFFGVDNWEMLVKVLDGCAFNDRFWVFAAATTNVEYALRVTDTESGRSMSYLNLLGTSAAAITDTDAFATCTDAAESRAEAPLAAPRRFRRQSPDKQGGCTAIPTRLCLNEGRFQVVVEWEDFQGNTGFGTGVPFDSEDSGLFWFFDAGNWELLVKVLDGCAFNNYFWVFSAATSNVGYTLRVTDTETDAVAEYFNPVGTSAAALTDTNAFASCQE